jgi:hypothetical protein
MYRNITGSCNTALGNRALQENTANGNTAVGFCALRNNTTGYGNVAMGLFALTANTTGVCNTALGQGAQCSSTTISNTIAVGIDSKTDLSDNHTVWGNTSNNVCNCVYVDWSNVSDARDKANISSLPDNLGLRFINKLRPVKFTSDHREVYVNKCGFEYGQKDGTLAGDKEHYGLIAQEIKQTLDELDVRFDALGHSDEQDAYRLTYNELIAPLIKAVQEIDQRLRDVEDKLAE